MVSWAEFERRAPGLARLGRERYDSTGLLMMGTLRKNGWPRVTPIEYTFCGDHLYIHGMWQSKKLLDLLRDPRCALHSTTANKDGQEGDFKLYATAHDVTDPEERERFGLKSFADTGWRPSEPFHLFRIDCPSAGFTVFGKEGLARMKALESSLGEANLAVHQSLGEGFPVITWRA